MSRMLPQIIDRHSYEIEFLESPMRDQWECLCAHFVRVYLVYQTVNYVLMIAVYLLNTKQEAEFRICKEKAKHNSVSAY